MGPFSLTEGNIKGQSQDKERITLQIFSPSHSKANNPTNGHCLHSKPLSV